MSGYHVLYIVVMRSYHVLYIVVMRSYRVATMYSQIATMYSQIATMYSATMYSKALKSNLLHLKIIRRIKKIACFFLENLKK